VRAVKFSIPITATAADIDELGHVSNQVYLRWVLEVARAHSLACGMDIADYGALGLIFIIRRHELDYIQPVLLGQELVASTWVEEWKASWCIRKTELTRDGVVVMRASTQWVMMSTTSNRPQRIPDQLRVRFES
jgi:acyl-CoA thioester hydrolase